MMAQDPGQVRAGFKHARSLTEFPHHLLGRVTLPLHYRHPPLGAGLTPQADPLSEDPVWRYQNDRSRARSCLVDQGIGTRPNGGSVRVIKSSAHRWAILTRAE